MKKKIVKLKNIYTKDIVFSENFDDVRKVNELEFIEVYSEDNPQRKYLVNRNAFESVTK
jgi:hypothetical protein